MINKLYIKNKKDTANDNQKKDEDKKDDDTFELIIEQIKIEE